MPDVVSPDVRSRMMSGIRGKDTKPEMLLRSQLHRRGLRFRVHDSKLPGRPDIVFPGPQAVVFINGCFWHGHEGCKYFKVPDTRREFWLAKINGTRDRDARAIETLRTDGWRVAVVWECSTRLALSDAVDSLETWIRGSSPELELALRSPVAPQGDAVDVG